MATFKIGDWVEITPTSDSRSELWDINVHTHFCGKIGQIEDITKEDSPIYNIKVYFDNHRPFGQPGNYTAWFENHHLIKSSEYNHRIKYELKKEFEEYMRIECKMKNLRDKYLKQIFSDPYESPKPRPLPTNVKKEIEETDWSDYSDNYYHYDVDD